jgi:hypothetical protein
MPSRAILGLLKLRQPSSKISQTNPNQGIINMLQPLNLLAAFLVAIILGTSWQLDEPSDISVMQQVAANKQAVQSDKLVLPGKP